MITNYTYKEFYASLGSKKLELQCEFCKKKFFATKRRIQEALRGNGKTKCEFCSKSCASKSKKTMIDLICHQCKTAFKRDKSNVKKSKSGFYFCSNKCSANFHSKCADRFL